MARFPFQTPYQARDQARDQVRHQHTPAGITRTHKRIRAITLCIYLTSLFALWSWIFPAQAAGGAHVIDDANVETAGKCHLDTWLTGNTRQTGLVNLTNVCVTEALPSLEFGATVQRLRDHDDDHNLVNTTTVGPTFKWNLRPSESGIGIALAGNTNWNNQSSRWEDAALMVPVTMPLGEKLTLNLNYGWSYQRDNADHRLAQTYGAQLVADIANNVSLMGEVFQRQHGLTGSQAGIRFTPNDGPVDIDLLYGRRVDGTTPRAITVGVTLRY